MNRSADFAAACPSQQPAGDPTTKLAVAGGPRVRIHLSPAERHVQRGALRAAARGLGQRPQERDRWFESGSLQGRVRCELVQKKRRSFTHKMSPARSRPAVESKIFEAPPSNRIGFRFWSWVGGMREQSQQYLFGYLAATPVAAQVALIDDRGRAALLSEVANALRTFIDDDGLAAPVENHVVVARK